MKTKNLFFSIMLFLAITNNVLAKNCDIHYNQLSDTPRLVHYNQDTLQYLISDFNDSAILYIGLPLKKLLNKLELKPRFFCSMPNFNKRDSISSFDIYFVDWKYYKSVTSTRKSNNLYRLNVMLNDPLNAFDFEKMERESNLIWTRIVKSNLGNKTIKYFKFYKK